MVVLEGRAGKAMGPLVLASRRHSTASEPGLKYTEAVGRDYFSCQTRNDTVLSLVSAVGMV